MQRKPHVQKRGQLSSDRNTSEKIPKQVNKGVRTSGLPRGKTSVWVQRVMKIQHLCNISYAVETRAKNNALENSNVDRNRIKNEDLPRKPVETTCKE